MCFVTTCIIVVLDTLGRKYIKQNCFLCHAQSTESICLECQKTFQTHSKRCVSCACVLEGNLDYCGICLTQKTIFDNAYTLYDYQGSIAHLIKQFKYEDRLFLGHFFAQKIKKAIEIIYTQQGIPKIIAMPLYKNKTKDRGFNQVFELLNLFDKNQLDNTSCQRIKETKSLTNLNLKERAKEIKNAFFVKEIQEAHILLVDDVMTTGASFMELAKMIRKTSPKVKRIDVLSLARGL
jgi:ComF family protein